MVKVHLQGNEGYVYLAETDTGHQKIGRSKDPAGRIKIFDTIMPIEVRVVTTFYCEDYIVAEKLLHTGFAEYRVKGEWFRLPSDAVDFIKSIFCFFLDEGWHCVDSLLPVARPLAERRAEVAGLYPSNLPY